MAELRDLLTGAIETAHLGLAELDAAGRFVAMNPPFLSMLAMRHEQLAGKHWRVTIHPDDYGLACDGYESAAVCGRGYAEIRALRGDGTIIHQALTITGIYGETGEFAGYHCLRYDISGHKRDQETLTLVIDSAPNGLLLVHPSGAIQRVNHAVEKLFGYSAKELIGAPVEMLLPERLRTSHRAHRGAVDSAETIQAMAGRDLRGQRKDGGEIPLQVHLNRIETGQRELILCSVIDISERVRYEQQLELAKQAAESANRAKSDFLARMSHEIRTPMNLIMGMNALLLESQIDSKQRRHLEISHRNIQRLLHLINGILDLSKVEAGKVTLDSAPFDLSDVLGECVSTAASAIETKGLRFEMAIDPAAHRYWAGDSERLQQVLLNLLGNAVKFTDQGEIAIRVRAQAGEGGESGLRFEISDTGCGVPPDKTGMIFEAFQQAESALNRRHEGTGLGLAIARTLVEQMGGRIWIESRTGPGATFIFTVFFRPVDEESVRSHASPAVTATVAQVVEPGTRILLVEDNPENLILFQAYLQNLSISLDLAANGIEAIEKRKRANYHLVLMDIQMPVMDGYTAAREIRKWEVEQRQPRVPIVAVTAHALNRARADSLEAGCEGHITKPLARCDLIEAIAKYSRPRHERRASQEEMIAARRPAFLASRRADLTRLRDALQSGDYERLRTIGHNCKGTGAGYGFPEISTAGAAIEAAARALDLASLEESIRDFESRVTEAFARMEGRTAVDSGR